MNNVAPGPVRRKLRSATAVLHAEGVGPKGTIIALYINEGFGAFTFLGQEYLFLLNVCGDTSRFFIKLSNNNGQCHCGSPAVVRDNFQFATELCGSAPHTCQAVSSACGP